MYINYVLYLFVFDVSSSYLINVKIVGELTTLRNDLTSNFNFNEIKSSKTHASNFSGPEDLRHLLGECFLYSSDKYNYRVCPFDNVTQHERLWHGNGYNGIIGIWKEWKIVNNTFDSLMYYNGDDCDDKLERDARMTFVCGQDNKVMNITEPNKCHYEISFSSNFACGERYIYPHLGREYRGKWDVIETNYFNEELTHLGYETSLQELFVEAGLLLDKSFLNKSNNLYFENKEKCLEKVVSLQKENFHLLERIQIIENALNKTRTVN